MTDQGTERPSLTPEEVLGLMLAQIRALHATNAALFAAMRGMVDMEQVRARALEMFPDPVADASAIAHVNAMMGPLLPPEPPADQEEPRSRFKVIEGGAD